MFSQGAFSTSPFSTLGGGPVVAEPLTLIGTSSKFIAGSVILAVDSTMSFNASLSIVPDFIVVSQSNLQASFQTDVNFIFSRSSSAELVGAFQTELEAVRIRPQSSDMIASFNTDIINNVTITSEALMQFQSEVQMFEVGINRVRSIFEPEMQDTFSQVTEALRIMGSFESTMISSFQQETNVQVTFIVSPTLQFSLLIEPIGEILWEKVVPTKNATWTNVNASPSNSWTKVTPNTSNNWQDIDTA